MWYSAVGFLVTLTLRMLVAPCAAAPPARIPTIGWLEQGGRADKAHLQAVFLQGLREFGYVEGQNLAMVHRDAEGHLDRLPALTAELVQLPVDVIVTTGGVPATRAAMQATTIIPIVMTDAGDPVGTGLVASLAQPGGNVTGLSNTSPDLVSKRLELLKEAAPSMARVAVLAHPPFAATHRLPTICGAVQFAEAGCLLSYSASHIAMYRRAAFYVDKILKGTQPADLPVEQPIKFELVINLKTAQALGLTIPPSLLFQANEVIR